MKLKTYQKIILSALVLVLLGVGFYMLKTSNVISIGGGGDVTTAYKNLYAAVHAKDTEKLKQLMSESTLKFVEGVAGQRNKSVGEVLENGLYASTINPELPEIRDERIKDDKYGAVEVFVKKSGKWEQVYFIKEDGIWKVAVGDLFAGTFQNPEKSKAQIEDEATNKMIPLNPNINGNFPSGNPASNSATASNVNTIQVEPAAPVNIQPANQAVPPKVEENK